MPQNKQQILQSEYLAARAKILELAATLDRLEAAGGSLDEDASLKRSRLEAGIRLLLDPAQTVQPPLQLAAQTPSRLRAEAVQLLFSQAYDADWPRPSVRS